MIIKHGDMFTTDAEAIGHGVNTHGIMGAGVAARVRAVHPRTFMLYQTACNEGTLQPGGCLVTRDAGIFVFNMATQQRPGPNAQLHLVKMATDVAIRQAQHLNIGRIAIPQIGCGIGGLQWPDVHEALADSEWGGFQWEVWIYE